MQMDFIFNCDNYVYLIVWEQIFGELEVKTWFWFWLGKILDFVSSIGFVMY